MQAAAGCGHTYCASCVARELLRGRFACAACKAPLSRAAFGQGGDGGAARGVAAASSLARELKARRRLAKILNRVREDFASDEAYYQYQEWAEDLAYRVVRGEDCEKEISEYKAANQAAIVARNQVSLNVHVFFRFLLQRFWCLPPVLPSLLIRRRQRNRQPSSCVGMERSRGRIRRASSMGSLSRS